MDVSATEIREKVSPFLDGESAPSYGLRQQVLSPLEVLAQSISTMAPSTTPTLTIPLVFALAGNGTWLAYLIAMAGMLLMSLCISIFARDSASPGSLYTYTRDTLPPIFAAIAAWALFFAYIMTASSVIGGFLNSSYLFLGRLGPHVPGALLAVVAAGGAFAIAYRDVKVSAQIMLWIEATSVCLIALVVALVLWKHGLHLDRAQLQLQGTTASGIRLGVMLAIFSFVGFESATTLGSEAREPLRNIPRAVIRSAALAGVFFIVCTYGETLGFHSSPTGLGESNAPMRFLSAQGGLPIAGPIIDAGVLVSMFAATLACIIAAARVLMLMAHHGLAHASLSRTHSRNETPAAASLLAAVLALLPVAWLAGRGVSGADIYGWMGALAVFGFLTAYALVAVAVPIHLRRHGRPRWWGVALSVVATVAMLAAILGTIYPIPPAPYRYLPLIYAVYLLLGVAWYTVLKRRRPVPSPSLR
ncbi:APC family permease [Edaphobacter bradus]|uniref:APC family permease n=1 Tax=Edaphobacter bradus TaxID=2259016 RepID=UPI0021E0D1A2|nr:APC family permease [Edaphobacter bradus]